MNLGYFIDNYLSSSTVIVVDANDKFNDVENDFGENILGYKIITLSYDSDNLLSDLEEVLGSEKAEEIWDTANYEIRPDTYGSRPVISIELY